MQNSVSVTPLASLSRSSAEIAYSRSSITAKPKTKTRSKITARSPMMSRQLAKQHRLERTTEMKLVYTETKDYAITDSKEDEFETQGEFDQLIRQEVELLLSVGQIALADLVQGWAKVPRNGELVHVYTDGSVGRWGVTYSYK